MCRASLCKAVTDQSRSSETGPQPQRNKTNHRCRSWVISGHSVMFGRMSALPPIADIGTQCRNVRFVPESDICSAAIGDLLEEAPSSFSPTIGEGCKAQAHSHHI